MSFQYTYDASGKPVGVFVPISEWEKITDELNKFQKSSKSKSSILKKIEKGFREVDAVRKGKLKSISFKQLLDEL